MLVQIVHRFYSPTLLPKFAMFLVVEPFPFRRIDSLITKRGYPFRWPYIITLHDLRRQRKCWISGMPAPSYKGLWASLRHNRFSRRTSKARGLLFYRLLQQAAASGPLPYKEIVHARKSCQRDLG